jgi:hypothetical protein
MRRVFGFGSATALVIVTACVGDHTVEPSFGTDGGTSADGGSSSSGGSSGSTGSQANLCGSLMENTRPSCPGTGTDDPGCTGTTTACCPGDVCVKADTATCPHAPSKPFLCFTGSHCNDAPPFTKRCCARGKLGDDPNKNGCNEPKQYALAADGNTTCSDVCAGDAEQLCRIGVDGKIDPHELPCPAGMTCTRTIIAIPNPKGGEPFLRAVGLCR